MNQTSRRRFTNGLTSGLTILAIFTFGFSMSGLVIASETPPANKTSQDKSSQVESMEIPGTFKELSGNVDAITSKRIVEDSKPTTNNLAPAPLPVIDATKGITSNSNNAVTFDGSMIESANIDLADFHATGYCLKGRTASGEFTRPGIIAADPRVLPLGTVVHIRAGRYTGKYTVLDTGARVKGRVIDIFFASQREAISFGRQRVKLQVLGRQSNAPRKIVRNTDPAQKNSTVATL